MFMQGGVSHVDTFDHKPRLTTDEGKPFGSKGASKLMASMWKFDQHGQCGHWVSELYPQVARHVDKLCMLHAMQTDQQAHETAVPFFHTGISSQARPSTGAWTIYGLGAETQELPGLHRHEFPAAVRRQQ